MKSLIIGATGQVGSLLYKECSKLGETVGTSRFASEEYKYFDLTDNDYIALDSILPDVIWWPAAETRVDLCTTDRYNTSNVNILGYAALLKEIKKRYEPYIIFYSTDYVFSNLTEPATPLHTPNPINEYGKQKLFVENMLEMSYNKYGIIRTSWVFGPDENRKNFAIRLIDKLRNGEEVKVTRDISNPTYSPKLVEKSIELYSKLKEFELSGIWHITGDLHCSRYFYALTIADVFNLDKDLIKKTRSKSLPARRPDFSALSNHDHRGILKPYDLDLIDALEDFKQYV